MRRVLLIVFFSSRRRHTRYWRDWSSDVCSSDLVVRLGSRRKKRKITTQILPSLSKRVLRGTPSQSIGASLAAPLSWKNHTMRRYHTLLVRLAAAAALASPQIGRAHV